MAGLTNQYITSLAISGKNIFAGGSGVYLSTNSGTIWTMAGLSNLYVTSLAVSCTNIFAGGSGVYLSTNSGTTWTTTGLTNQYITSLAASGTNIFAGGNGVFLSTNSGTTWTSAGLTNQYITSLAVSSTNIFAATYGNNVWMRPLSEMVTVFEVSKNNLPTDYVLKQNYPNPFNPSTMIEFSIKNNSWAKLIVYDMLGREVTTLVNENKSAGTYKVKFDASHLSSGVYLYKLETNGFTQSKKMLLLK